MTQADELMCCLEGFFPVAYSSELTGCIAAGNALLYTLFKVG